MPMFPALEPVPRRDDDRRIVLKVTNDDEGMTVFDAVRTATAETRGTAVLSSEKEYEDIEGERVPLEPADE